MSKVQNEKRVYTILIYGIERKGLSPPEEGINRRNFNLIFEPFSTDRRFNEFDGVILFQGIFEKFERKNGGYFSEPYLEHSHAWANQFMNPFIMTINESEVSNLITTGRP